MNVTGVSGIIPEIAFIFFLESPNDLKTESTHLSWEGNGNSLSILAWEIPWTVLFMASQRVRHNWATEYACSHLSWSHHSLPVLSFSFSYPWRGLWERLPRLLSQGLFLTQFPRGHCLLVTPGHGCPLRSLWLCCFPSLALLPSASQPQCHHLPSLFTPAHSSLMQFKMSDTRWREAHVTVLFRLLFHAPPHLTHYTLFLDVPLVSKAEGV